VTSWCGVPWQDYILTLCFIVEMTSKIIVLGFFFQRGAYLRDPWNSLDCFVVVSSVAGIAASLQGATGQCVPEERKIGGK
jgi:hypothetical protein